MNIYKVLVIIVLILGQKNLTAQTKLNDTKFVYSDSIIQKLNEQIPTLINFIISDSMYSKYNYLLNTYYSPITIASYEHPIIKNNSIKKRHKHIKNNKEKGEYKKESERVYFNPFNKEDYPFIIYQNNINTFLKPKLIKEKQIIKSLESVNVGVLCLEKPIFSKNFDSAFITISIVYKNDFSVYRHICKKKNGIWVIIKTQNLMRT